MSKKGFANTMLVIVIVVLIGLVGYFALVRKSESPPVTQTPLPIAGQTEEPTTQPPTIQNETASWETYQNEKYGFQFKYPKDSELQVGTRFSFDLSVDLPFAPGTKLTDKRMSIVIEENSTSEDCFGSIEWHGVTEVNEIQFHYIPGFEWEHAMGGKSFFASDYFTMRNNNCIGLEFRLGLSDPTGFVDPSTPIPPDPPEEDLDTEVFDKMLSTFRFLE